MIKTYLHIPEDLNREINQLAQAKKTSKAAVLRAVLKKGVDAEKREKTSGAEVLLELAAYAKKHRIQGPRDLSINHDYYLWGFPKKNPRIKP